MGVSAIQFGKTVRPVAVKSFDCGENASAESQCSKKPQISTVQALAKWRREEQDTGIITSPPNNRNAPYEVLALCIREFMMEREDGPDEELDEVSYAGTASLCDAGSVCTQTDREEGMMQSGQITESQGTNRKRKGTDMEETGRQYQQNCKQKLSSSLAMSEEGNCSRKNGQRSKVTLLPAKHCSKGE